MVGSGKNLNEACDNGLKRLSELSGLSLDEVKNRCTITGQVEIGRLPGVVHVSMLVPRKILENVGLWNVVASQYDYACQRA